MATKHRPPDITAQLLTAEAKQAAFVQILGGRLANPDTLFLPGVAFYDKLATDSGLSSAARDLFRWLGVKPQHATVRYGNTAAKAAICIPDTYRQSPYQAGAVLALAAIRTIAAQQADQEPAAIDQSFVEFASIEAGLGILVLNGIYPPHSAWETMMHGLHGHWHSNDTVLTHAYHPATYADAVLDYAANRQLSQRHWAGYLHLQARSRIIPTATPARLQPHPFVVQAHTLRAKSTIARMALAGAAAGLAVTTGLFIVAQRPLRPSAQAVEQYQEVVLRKQAYEACAMQVKDMSRGSESNDIFADQALNATKSRCMSLQNNYNAAVSRYNALLPQ